MVNEFTLPDLGEGIHEAEVLAVRVAEGDKVVEDQPILEVETDKAVVEIPCPINGVIKKIHVKQGDTVTVGSVMISFGESGQSCEHQSQDSRTEHVSPQKSNLPQASQNKQSSQAAQSETPEKTLVASGNGRHAILEAPSNGRVPAAPATRRMARELGLDINIIRGSGPAGRVLNEDVRAYAAGSLEGTIASPSSDSHPIENAPVKQALASKYGGDTGSAGALFSNTAGAPPSDLPDFEKFGPVERIPLRSIRRKIAQNMTQAWTHIPHVTHFDEADVTQLEKLRAEHESEVKALGGKLTLTVLTLKAIASGLKKYPQFNASLDERTGEIIFKHYYNIGVAVATERGLIVPVIKNVDQKSLIQLSAELADIADKTRSGKVEIDRLQGGTFTVTNIGAIGGTSMVPMVNYPEAAILGMARATEKPVVREGKIEIALIMPLALSFDHRIADGAEAAYFVQHIVKRLQAPFRLLLEA